MSSRDRSGRGRSRWNNEDDMDISNSDDERKSRSHSIRDGILFSHSNYYQFLIKWVAEMSSKNPSREKKLKENISQASIVEKERINLPPHEKMNVLHCDITVKGLPPFSFCGSGYGSERKTAYFAAAKDFMDKCLKMGIITRDLHEAIGNKPSLEMNRRLPDFMRSLDVIHQLDTRISKASWRDNIDQTRNLIPTDFAQLDRFIAESREAVYGVDAPVYDSSFCGLCKRKTHIDTCPYGLEEKRLQKLKRAQEEREMERRDRRGRSRSRSRDRDRGRDSAREQKEKERLEIERKILEQREALTREDEERKLREATDRARAAALAFGGGGIPMIGGPGAAPLVTPGLSGSANPLGIMMNNHESSHYMNPFHPLNTVGPSPEMMASMAQFASMMEPSMGTGGGGGYSTHKDPVTIPTGYAAHVQSMEDQRMRLHAEEMARRAVMERDEMERRALQEREREEMERREKNEGIEARLRAEMEAKLHQEIEQKRREMEMELREKLAPREVRKLGGMGGDFGDFGAAMSAYGMSGNISTSIPTSMPMNPYAGMPNAYTQSSSSWSPPALPSMESNGSNPYSQPISMQSMQQIQQQQPQLMHEMPEFIEIKSLVNENSDALKNLAYARDQTLATHPVLVRVGGLANNAMTQMELRELRDELKDFLDMLQKRAQDGRIRPAEVKKEMKMERGGGRNDRRDDRRRRSRSRSYERRGERNDRRDDRRDDRRRGQGGGGIGGSGNGWGQQHGRRDISNEVKKEEVIDADADIEVIVQVGGNKFRQLREKEALCLKKDSIVVAQDLKSGKWSTAKVLKVIDKRVQLVVGNAVWKKEYNEVYTPM